MSKPLPQWMITIGGVTCIIRIASDGGRVELGTDGPGGPLLAGSSLEAVQLGMALQEASKVCGELRAKRAR